MVTLFGIPNCDTVKKARTWLADNNIEFTFHDFRKDGLSATQVDTWLADLGCDTLVNKRSTSWKTLSEEVKTSLNDASASSLVLASPTLIKRPLLDRDGSFSVGFKVADYETLFNQ